MKRLKSSLILFFACLATLSNAQPNLRLWYDKPAADWNAALPIGNGTLAAMIFGGPAVERLQLNEGTVWAGSPNNNLNPEALAALPKIRELIFANKNLEAMNMATAKIISPTNSGMPYQSMGDLYLSFPGHNGYKSYTRDLNISNAVASVKYTVKGVTYTREYYSSLTDSVLVVRLKASKPKSITCNLSMSTPHQKYRIYDDNGMMVLTGLTETHERLAGKVRFITQVKPLLKNGRCMVKDGILSIEQADEAVIYISMATNFVNYKDISGNEEAKCTRILNRAYGKDFDKLKASHVAAYQKLFNRVTLDLGTTPQALKPTEQRIREFAKSNDPALVALYFQFGRYLLISCSQPGGQPATLQGLWNEQILPPWDSKYTININTEMNYWPSEVANLTEMNDPLFAMIKDISVTGRDAARTMYGARGWVTHHNTDIWRTTGAVDRAHSGMWPMAGAWFSRHLWEHYQYTGDKEFLQANYPIMAEAARFFVDFLVKEPSHGWLVVCPSSSPENIPKVPGINASNVAGCTMDNQLVFDLFTNVLAATDVLNGGLKGLFNTGSKAFADTLRNTLAQMPPMQVGQYSQLQEWMHDWDDPKDTHRHISHLFGLYPGNQISPYRTPELFDAARTSLIYRGDVSTGWAMAWRLCFWARLLDGNHAYKILQNQLDLVSAEPKKGGTYTNMFCAHPPFQIDGNFGCVAGISEMLLQSQDGFIFVLPALPDVWKNGSVKGLKARGGFEFDIVWKANHVETLKIKSTLGGICRIRSAVELTGKGLKPAKGDNPNPYYRVAETPKPLISEKAKLKPVVLPETMLYDLKMEPGETITLTHKD
ncbi:MAG TPA: glycoside hydrolase family 95 protein [Bacteroidales bacterium]|nr:glycoside hydrolase family 95 protein [Bacteroidales bacterium]